LRHPVNGYLAAAGQMQARESSPVRDRRSTTELRRSLTILELGHLHLSKVGGSFALGEIWLDAVRVVWCCNG